MEKSQSILGFLWVRVVVPVLWLAIYGTRAEIPGVVYSYDGEGRCTG